MLEVYSYQLSWRVCANYFCLELNLSQVRKNISGVQAVWASITLDLSGCSSVISHVSYWKASRTGLFCCLATIQCAASSGWCGGWKTLFKRFPTVFCGFKQIVPFQFPNTAQTALFFFLSFFLDWSEIQINKHNTARQSKTLNDICLVFRHLILLLKCSNNIIKLVQRSKVIYMFGVLCSNDFYAQIQIL